METQRHKDSGTLSPAAAEHKPIPDATEKVASGIVEASFRVHSTLGPGLLESVYEACMSYELRNRGIPFNTQVSFPVVYDGLRLDPGFRLDLLVAKAVVVELKSVESMHPVFEAQVLTYLKITGLRLGLLINFNVSLIQQGIKRIVR